MKPLIVIPAAGASSRMRGRDKLLEQIDGEALLRRQAKAALATGCPVLVCLPPSATERRAVLTGLDLTLNEVPDAAEGLGATLRSAASYAIRNATGRAVMILLPDVPGIRTADIKRVIDAFIEAGGDTPTRATDETDAPGTPLIIPERMVPSFTMLSGDDGGKSALRDEAVTLVPLQSERAIQDLDTPEDWDSWRHSRANTK